MMRDYMTEDEWMEMRAEAFKYEKERCEKLINEWCKDSGVTTPIGYTRDSSSKTMIIYTSQPGYLIGRAGVKVNKFKEALKKEFRDDYSVKFVEVKGGFTNL